MRTKFNVMLIALEQRENYLDIRFFKTMDSACRFGKELKDYNENFAILGVLNVKKNSNHSWKVSICDKMLKIKHQVFVYSKKECKIVARMFLEYNDKYNITFKKRY
jgi:hypothetical protein